MAASRALMRRRIRQPPTAVATRYGGRVQAAVAREQFAEQTKTVQEVGPALVSHFRRARRRQTSRPRPKAVHGSTWPNHLKCNSRMRVQLLTAISMTIQPALLFVVVSVPATTLRTL